MLNQVERTTFLNLSNKYWWKTPKKKKRKKTKNL